MLCNEVSVLLESQSNNNLSLMLYQKTVSYRIDILEGMLLKI